MPRMWHPLAETDQRGPRRSFCKHAGREREDPRLVATEPIPKVTAERCSRGALGGVRQRPDQLGHTPAGTWPGTLAVARDDAARRLIGPRFRARRLSADSCFSAARGKLIEPPHARPSRRWRANRRAITGHGGAPRCRAADRRTPSAWPKHDTDHRSRVLAARCPSPDWGDDRQVAVRDHPSLLVHK